MTIELFGHFKIAFLGVPTRCVYCKKNQGAESKSSHALTISITFPYGYLQAKVSRSDRRKHTHARRCRESPCLCHFSYNNP